MRKNILCLFQVLLCSLPMGLVAYLICSLGDWSVAGNVGTKVLLLGSGITAGLGVYLGCSYWVRNKEMLFLLSMIKRKTK